MGEKQSKPIPPTLIERLSNEIFIEIFSYLNGVDAAFAFSRLNYRFQCLLLEYCQFFDCKSASKVPFELVFRRHDTQQWKSLQLYDDDDTSGQIEYFNKNYSFVEHFPQLQSLSLLEMKTEHIYRLLYQLRSLTNLNSLTIESICGKKCLNISLPKLKRLAFSSCRNTKWIKNFSQLETLEYTIITCHSCKTVPIWPLTLKRLKISFLKDEDVILMQGSLANLSKLITLEICQKERGRLLPNGQVWENLICSSLPLLQNFKFYFQFEVFPYSTNQVKQIVTSFSTPFYKREKNWFIRCDMSREYPYPAVLYSLPFPFDQFTILTNSFDESISTFFHDTRNN
ncbi:unnamed protein product [Rotaria sp. Silwood1]|nr:unnamed protein product [Rotaria sp. Silwood1]CAF4997136.1 unnamed protein product [Rotaria sp. Silwood1]